MSHDRCTCEGVGKDILGPAIAPELDAAELGKGIWGLGEFGLCLLINKRF